MQLIKNTISIGLDHAVYRDKVKACFIGKNIGGTIGGPYEAKRELLDVHGFTTKPGEPLPNDDLDLQLVWLHAIEHLGPQGITADALGEFWLSFIHPGWNEYGIGKANMMRGVCPPMSGDLDNNWKHSNGAWIRTEVWATIAPAIPTLAAKFAMEDAKVDHGAGEGTVAAAFVAAMQSSAFVLSSVEECIAVGLAAIPEESRVSKSVRLVLDSYAAGKTWQEARNAVLAQNADIGDGWFEAPSNVAYAVLGLVYGEGDFKRSMLTAVNCGDDTDCTAATVGATLGILRGMDGIPADWAEYIGDKIVTVSIAKGDVGKSVPDTCTELTERIVALAEVVLYYYNVHFYRRIHEKSAVRFGDAYVPSDILTLFTEKLSTETRTSLTALAPYSLHVKQAFIDADLTLSSPTITVGGEITVKVSLLLDYVYDNSHRPLRLRWILPDGMTADGPQSALLARHDRHHACRQELTYTIKAEGSVAAENRAILEITSPGRHTALYASFVLFG